jgi:hypothetical protein
MELSYSVEVDVSRAFAWRYRTDVTTWSDPPASFSLEGPFQTGANGMTLLPRQASLRWRIGDVKPGESFVLEMPLDRATLSFEWKFEELPGSRTRLTQHIVLTGENAEAYVGQVEAGFGPNLEAGMKKLAAEMAAAAAAIPPVG